MPKKTEKQIEFQQGRGYSKEDWDEVSDNPEWTEEDFKNARPFAEVFPDLAESIRRARGRPAVETPKRQISLLINKHRQDLSVIRIKGIPCP